MKYLNKKSGFTLIELLIATLLSSILVGIALKVYLAQHKHLIVQEQITDMQQNSRSSMEELASKIRMAGYNIPVGLSPLIASNANPDSIELVYDSGALDGVKLEQAMAAPSADLQCTGHDLTGANDNDWLYIYDPTAKTGEFFLATQIQYGTSQIQHNTMNLSKSYPLNSRVFKIVMMKYYINNTTDAAHPRLMVSCNNQAAQIYADNISDLQFQYVLSSGAIVDSPAISTMVREVIITMTARTDKADQEFATNYRNRVIQTRVKVRNLGIQ